MRPITLTLQLGAWRLQLGLTLEKETPSSTTQLAARRERSLRQHPATGFRG